MYTYEFEVAAKNAVIDLIREQHEEEFEISDISVVYMVHVLGNKKCILIDNGENNRLYEVTYNAEKNEIYVDEYDKVVNHVVPASDFKFTAK